jgi:hypothetical protein
MDEYFAADQISENAHLMKSTASSLAEKLLQSRTGIAGFGQKTGAISCAGSGGVQGERAGIFVAFEENPKRIVANFEKTARGHVGPISENTRRHHLCPHSQRSKNFHATAMTKITAPAAYAHPRPF